MVPAHARSLVRLAWQRRIRGLVGILLVTLVASGLAAVSASEPAAAKPRQFKPPAAQEEPLTPHRVLDETAPPLAAPPKLPAPLPATEWPAPAEGMMTVGAPGPRVRVVDTPVLVNRPGKVGAQGLAAEPTEVAVEVKGRRAAKQLGIDGVIFTVAPETADADGQLSVALDYSSFSNALGAGYGSRLRLVRLPSCALSTPAVVECRATEEIDSVNDSAQELVSATVSVAAAESAGAESLGPQGAAEPMVFAAVASASGPAGSFKATSLSPAGSWAVSGAAGAFSWSHPIPVTSASGGMTPKVELSYSSAAVDGKTLESNNQPSWVGEGWDYNPGYVERTYRTCADDKSLPDARQTNDLCWAGQIVTLSLGGKTTRLVRDDQTNTWHAESDDAERVQLVTGADNDARNGEHWVVTTTDGVRYHFGLGKLPGGGTDDVTNSVLTVPVVGPRSGDPCYDSAGIKESRCSQAYRWNLDYVEDPRGNAAAYYYQREFNHYNAAKLVGENDLIRYTRGGNLTRIDHGLRNVGGTVVNRATPPYRVVFDTAERCLQGATVCDPDVFKPANAEDWRDTPFDLACSAGQTEDCHNTTPSFWTRKRLVAIRTQYRDGSTYRNVDRFALTHDFPNDAEDALTLTGISRTGYAPDGTTKPLPATTFTGVAMPNRVLVGGGASMMFHRLKTINTETGQSVTVAYNTDAQQAGRARPACTGTSYPSSPATNTMMCFPVKSRSLEEGGDPLIEWFHKYVVTEVIVADRHAVAPARYTRYNYLGDPAWHFDDNEVVRPGLRTYGQFRGYRQVEMRTGSPTSAANGEPDKWTLSTTTYLRGMGGTTTDSRGGVHANGDQYADAVLESQTFLGDSATELSTTITDWETADTTATQQRGDADLGPLTAHIVRPSRTHTITATSSTSTGGRLDTTTANTYDSLGRLTQKSETGTDVPARCTTTAYAEHTAERILTRPTEVKVATGECGAGGVLVSLVQNRYDDRSDTKVGAYGEVTTTLTATDDADQFAKATNEYDAAGRITATTSHASALDLVGRSTTIAYTPEVGGPVTKVTTTNPLGQTSSVHLDPGRATPVRSVDVAGNVTAADLDPLGRVTAVWEPGHVKGTDPATTTYAYRVDPDVKPTLALTTKTLVDNGASKTYHTKIDIFDAFGSLRQTQAAAVGSNRLVSDTFNDSHGWVAVTNNYWYTDGAPAAEILKPLSDNGVPSRTIKKYDGAGREILSTEHQGVTPKWSTKTVHAGDRTTVIPPTGGVVATKVNDARGQLTQVQRWGTPPTSWNGNAPVGGTFQATTYTYDAAGNQTGIKAPGGATWSSTYDLAGRVTHKVDPDVGETTLNYNDLGELTSTTDAREQVLSYRYDKLSRQIEERVGGTLTAEWAYDTYTNSDDVTITQPGALIASVRHHGGKDYTVSTTRFDAVGRPLGSRVELDEPGFLTSYTSTQEWTTTGLVSKETLPDTRTSTGDGQYPEDIHRSYDTFGNPTTTTGINGYVTETLYSPYGEVNRYSQGSGDIEASVNYTRDVMTRRVTEVLMSGWVAPPQLEKMVYEYDPAGNITKTVNTQGGGTTAPVQTQCYQYTKLNQLSRAWSSLDSCATTPTSANRTKVGGPQRFWHDWSFDPAGNRTAQTQYGTAAASDSVTTYTTSTPGHAHALTSTSTKVGTGTPTPRSFGYDANGNMTSRKTADSKDQSLTYDPHNRVDTVTTGSGTDQFQVSYEYDADGNQLLRRDKTSTTLYLPGVEVTYLRNTNRTNTTRYYTHNGAVVALRRNTLAPNYLLSDQHGSNQVAVNPSTWSISRRYLDPYGNVLGTAGTAWPDKHGFLDKPHSTETGLTDIGARKYDPTIGRFITVDPILAADDPTQLNGYQYGGNNPINRADPTGLRPPCVEEGTCDYDGHEVSNYQPPADEPAYQEPSTAEIADAWSALYDEVLPADVAADMQRAEVELADDPERLANHRAAFLALQNSAPQESCADEWWCAPLTNPIVQEAVPTIASVGVLGIEMALARRAAAGAVAANAGAHALPAFPKALAGGASNTHVYYGLVNGKPAYAGITNNLGRRQAQHGSRYVLDPLTTSPVTRGQARAIEQALIVRNPGFNNKINSISPNHSYYQAAVDWGEAWLVRNGY